MTDYHWGEAEFNWEELAHSDLLIGVPSHNRPHSVERMQEFYEWIVWCVPDEKQAKTYRNAGASNVVVSYRGRGTCQQRNVLIEVAEEGSQIPILVDDDLMSLYERTGNSGSDKIPMRLPDAALTVAKATLCAEAAYGGLPVTTNPFHGASRVHTRAFVQATFTCINPNYGLTWDEDRDIQLVDEWDMTCRSLIESGSCARVDWILADFNYAELEKNKVDSGLPIHNVDGGLDYTVEARLKACRIMLSRYPNLVKRKGRPPKGSRRPDRDILDLALKKTMRNFTMEQRLHYSEVNSKITQDTVLNLY